ncbi:hypothetical protein SAMD00019534_057420 [Acytostelium subglobosum LB1]|uniref:hypothetical protein n=1 Tax=Acytostelium subglobosum LB1 TaxID=1410327 RepID=UPI000644D874|nr:hypothetical protein SAMD00019534_057420 [Acytostelium subglobosum LB1]GAM22567.1 hypothetical protein SAMD00019534_057420 [Acytostelium subglobosum LB1]|eukprot:XP_012754687.1 hypothetical protein SAMD00019534_057420 [Acytostelium subglobosum LB1]
MIVQSNAWIENQALDIHVVPFVLMDASAHLQHNNELRISNAMSLIMEGTARKIIIPDLLNYRIWWDKQDQDTKDKIGALVKSGNIEFVNGAPVMMDETLVDFKDYVTQLSQGIHWLNVTFGVAPINAFNPSAHGHTEAIASLMAAAGIKNVVVSRINSDMKDHMFSNGHLEFLWKESSASPSPFELFVHVTPNDEIGIANFCSLDPQECQAFEFVNWTTSDQELTAIYPALLDQYQKKALRFRSNQLLVPFGNSDLFLDMNYTRRLFSNYETMFVDINQHDNEANKISNIQWSTLADYFQGIKNSPYSLTVAPVMHYGEKISQDQSVPGMPAKPDSQEYSDFRGDLSSISNDESTHYSILHEHRLQMETVSNLLRTVENMYSMVKRDESTSKSEMDIIQSCRNVIHFGQRAESYVGQLPSVHYEWLQEALNQCSAKLRPLLSELTVRSFECNAEDDTPLSITLVGEVSSLSPQFIQLATQKRQTVFFYNPSDKIKEEVVRLLVDTPSVLVVNNKNTPIMAQLNPVWADDNTSAVAVPIDSHFEVCFMVQVEPLSVTSYTLSLYMEGQEQPPTTVPATVTIMSPEYIEIEWDIAPFSISQAKLGSQSIVVKNSMFSAQLSHETGHIQKLFVQQGKQSEEVFLENQEMVYQHAKVESSMEVSDQVKSEGMLRTIRSPPSSIRHIQGAIIDEVVVFKKQLEGSPFHKQRIMLTEGESANVILLESTMQYAEEQAAIDPIVRILVGGEGVGDLDREHSYYVDVNGYMLAKRVVNPRQDYHQSFTPMSSGAFFGGSNTVSGIKVGVLSRTPLGVASKDESMLDVMLHRGGHKSNERVTVPVWLTISQGKDKSLVSSSMSINSPLIAGYSPQQTTNNNMYVASKCARMELIPELKLPENVHLIAMQPLDIDLISLQMFEPTDTKRKHITHKLDKLLPKFEMNNESAMMWTPPSGGIVSLSVQGLHYSANKVVVQDDTTEPQPSPFTQRDFQEGDKANHVHVGIQHNKGHQNTAIQHPQTDDVPIESDPMQAFHQQKLEQVDPKNKGLVAGAVPVVETGTNEDELRVQDRLHINNKGNKDQHQQQVKAVDEQAAKPYSGIDKKFTVDVDANNVGRKLEKKLVANAQEAQAVPVAEGGGQHPASNNNDAAATNVKSFKDNNQVKDTVRVMVNDVPMELEHVKDNNPVMVNDQKVNVKVEVADKNQHVAVGGVAKTVQQLPVDTSSLRQMELELAATKKELEIATLNANRLKDLNDVIKQQMTELQHVQASSKIQQDQMLERMSAQAAQMLATRLREQEETLNLAHATKLKSEEDKLIQATKSMEEQKKKSETFQSLYNQGMNTQAKLDMMVKLLGKESVTLRAMLKEAELNNQDTGFFRSLEQKLFGREPIPLQQQLVHVENELAQRIPAVEAEQRKLRTQDRDNQLEILRMQLEQTSAARRDLESRHAGQKTLTVEELLLKTKYFKTVEPVQLASLFVVLVFVFVACILYSSCVACAAPPPKRKYKQANKLLNSPDGAMTSPTNHVYSSIEEEKFD